MIKTLLIAVAALSLAATGAANAGKHHKRHKVARHHAPAVAYVPAGPQLYPGARPPWAAPQQCFIEEGYGRFFPCGGGPSVR